MYSGLYQCLLHGRRLCSCCVSIHPTLDRGMLTYDSEMPVNSLKPLVKALLDQLPDDPSSIVISVKSETEPPLSPDPRKGSPTGPAYDPSHVYLLEFCTVLAIRDSETIAELGADVAEALMNVMRNASSFHSIMISRTIFYLLHLLHASFVSYVELTMFISANYTRNTHSSVYQSSCTQYRVLKRTYWKRLLHLSFKD